MVLGRSGLNQVIVLALDVCLDVVLLWLLCRRWWRRTVRLLLLLRMLHTAGLCGETARRGAHRRDAAAVHSFGPLLGQLAVADLALIVVALHALVLILLLMLLLF